MSFEKRAYIYDSYLDTFEAEVVSCDAIENNKYKVILDKTIFYPHMLGGQVKDKGTINGIEVVDVYEENDEIVHILDKKVNGKVSLKIDFQTRFDHMQQHTGQHILSCSFWNLFEAKTIGFHMSDTYTTIDLDKKDFTADMIKSIENYANNIIYQNIKIDTPILSHEDSIKTGLRKPPVGDELIRIVKIGDKDNVACCGTHTKYTGEGGIAKIVKYENYKSGIRVEFLCGKRALEDYINKNNDIHKMSNVFSCKTDKVLESIDKMKDDCLQYQKQIGMLQEQIAQYEVNNLLSNSIKKDNTNFIFKLMQDRESKEIRNIASKLVENESCVCGFVIKSQSSLNVILAQSKELNYDIKSVFKECQQEFSIRGGGNDFMLQGTIQNSVDEENILDKFKKIAR